MSTKNKKIKTDKEREEERCGGCECRRVPCSRCGTNDNLYNMNHPEFHNDYWFDGMEFEVKLAEVLCDDCVNGCSSEEEGGGDY